MANKFSQTPVGGASARQATENAAFGAVAGFSNRSCGFLKTDKDCFAILVGDA